MSIIVTGGSGFLGTALIDRLTAVHSVTIYDLSRHPRSDAATIPLVGDITQPDLGIKLPLPGDIDTVFHLAANHDLGLDKKGIIQRTNIEGTRNVVDFCKQHGIEHLYFCSTAYTQGRNPYEVSKIRCEEIVSKSGIPHVVIFKPSIIMGSETYVYTGHFLQFISLIIKVHKTAEKMRRAFEGTMRLPALRPAFRIPGDPEAHLNLVPVEAVADFMAGKTEDGTYWLTNPNPPKLQEICDWVSEVILVDLKMAIGKFPAMPLEAGIQRYGRAFLPYLWGDNFSSSLDKCEPVDRVFIQRSVGRVLLKETGGG